MNWKLFWANLVKPAVAKEKVLIKPEAEKIETPSGVDRKFFFDEAKRVGLFKKYTQLQVDSIDAIIDEINIQNITNQDQIAYIFATGYHEGYDYDGRKTGTVQRLVPIQESGSARYLKALWYWPNIGYGFVQVTHLRNHLRVQELIKKERGVTINVVKNPKSLLDIKVSAFALVYGMMHGIYTTKALGRYVNDTRVDFLGARRVVNGTDKAYTIAAYAKDFQKCVKIINP